MDVITILAMGFVCMACFFMGAKVGQQASKGETIETPTINPFEAIQEHQTKREAKRQEKEEKERIDTILRNIDAYDGTGFHQEDVPGR